MVTISSPNKTARHFRHIRHIIITALALLAFILAACQGFPAQSSEPASTTPASSETSSASSTTSTTAKATPTPPATTATDITSQLNALDSSGIYAVPGGVHHTDGGYAFPYGENIVFSIQSDVQRHSGLNLIQPDGTWIQSLIENVYLTNVIVVGHFCFALDQADQSNLVVLDIDQPSGLYPLDIHTSGFSISDGFIYYLDLETGALFRCHLDGSGREQLTEAAVAEFQVLSDRIIFVEMTSWLFIRRTSLDGGDRLPDLDYPCSSFTISGEKVLYGCYSGRSGDYNYGIGVMDLDLIYLEEEIIQTPFDVGSFTIVDDILYCTRYDESAQQTNLWAMSRDGTDARQISTVNEMCGIQVIGDYIYFRSNEYRSQHCVMKTDGSGFQVLFEE